MDMLLHKHVLEHSTSGEKPSVILLNQAKLGQILLHLFIEVCSLPKSSLKDLMVYRHC